MPLAILSSTGSTASSRRTTCHLLPDQPHLCLSHKAALALPQQHNGRKKSPFLLEGKIIMQKTMVHLHMPHRKSNLDFEALCVCRSGEIRWDFPWIHGTRSEPTARVQFTCGPAIGVLSFSPWPSPCQTTTELQPKAYSQKYHKPPNPHNFSNKIFLWLS